MIVQATYEPQPHLRDVAIDTQRAALVFIDVQNFNCHPDGAEFQGDADVRPSTTLQIAAQKISPSIQLKDSKPAHALFHEALHANSTIHDSLHA